MGKHNFATHFCSINFTHYLSITSLILLYGFLVLNIFFKNENFENIQIILSSVLFSFIHFKASDFNQLFSIYPIMIIFSLGLIAIWITLNFGLLKAIYLHAIWNLCIMFLVFIALQYPDLNKKQFENEIVKIEFERSPLINNGENGISYSRSKIIAKSVTLHNLLDFLNQVEKEKNSNQEYYQTEVFMKYNFQIYLKDSTKNFSQPIFKFLQKEKLLKIKYNNSNY
ncbi:CPBP family intramembrane glutamic endopeptidase [Hanstruepera marina]|uniref:CPBP family intramembrane glutamic endopeptidase n=1 Tax=Hanstruepera marina TaxID=2873265 RepID=UPI001CA73CEB|nr:CPBP family intramembrane glutamic endopeptidase [Hanstruepera marina]